MYCWSAQTQKLDRRIEFRLPVTLVVTASGCVSELGGVVVRASDTVVDIGLSHSILPHRGGNRGMTGQSAPTVLAERPRGSQAIISGVTHLWRLPERCHVTCVGPDERRYRVTSQSAPER